MYPVECVARGYLTGSGLADYRGTGEVCGVALPAGLEDGSRLPAPIFTPATKAAVGDHDENVSYDAVAADGRGGRRRRAARPHAAGLRAGRGRSRGSAGIILADTKLEFGARARRHGRARRRGAHPRLVAVLAGRPVAAGPAAAVVRQADRPRLADLARPAAGTGLGRGSRPPLPAEVVERTRCDVRRGLRAADRPAVHPHRQVNRREESRRAQPVHVPRRQRPQAPRPGRRRARRHPADLRAGRTAPPTRSPTCWSSRGIQPGDKVALSCPNLPYFPIVYYGILKAGAVVVPLNVLLKGREIAYHLGDSEAKAYFCFQGTPDLPMGDRGPRRASSRPTAASTSS